MNLSIANSGIGAAVLQEQCNQLLGHARRVFGAEEPIDPSDVPAHEAMLSIASFICLESGGLAYGHPETSEAEQWRDKYLTDFDNHSSEMWIPGSKDVKERREEEKSVLDKLVAICKEYNG